MKILLYKLVEKLSQFLFSAETNNAEQCKKQFFYNLMFAIYDVLTAYIEL